jgi:hypothetical protein
VEWVFSVGEDISLHVLGGGSGSESIVSHTLLLEKSSTLLREDGNSKVWNEWWVWGSSGLVVREDGSGRESVVSLNVAKMELHTVGRGWQV